MVQVTVYSASTRSTFKIKCYVAHNFWCKTFVDCLILKMYPSPCDLALPVCPRGHRKWPHATFQ